MDTNQDDRIIECPQCQIKNPVESDICYNCGVSLHEVPSKKISWNWLQALLIILLGVGVFYWYYRPDNKIPQPQKTKKTAPQPAIAFKKKLTPPVQSFTDKKTDNIETEIKQINLPVGTVRIKDVTGNLITEISVPVVGGGWIALPTQVSLGGYEWVLQMNPQSALEIEGGIISDQDQVGLWRIREDRNLEGPALQAWSPDRPLAWLALRSQDPLEPIELQAITEKGNFITASVPSDLSVSGVFMQDDRVVGWTFGNLMDGAFLWAGDEGRNLKTDIRVDDYYRLTFANGREEEFAMALAMGDNYSDLDRLEAFVQAFRFDPKLSANQTPVHLKTDAISRQLRSLIERAVQQGFAVQAANYFDAEVLIQAKDVNLLSDVVLLTAEGYGFEEAVNLAEGVIEDLQLPEKDEITQLNKLHSGLYQNWLTVLLESGEIEAAWRVFERAGQQRQGDLNIYLLGVKLALAENDWAAAEELLSAREYPSELREQVRSLQAQISELKGQEARIVIRFTPGVRQIPVTASLNQGTPQNFIVDTGATMVTIPFSTAEDLGIIITVRNPRRTVYTAGGVIYAPEVVLDSINLDGFETTNVKALVMDLPNQPDWGLLGLNYLRRFRMDLNTDEGVLSLEPR